MRLSTKGRYGLKALLELSINYGEGPVLMGTIAKKQNISRKYLHAILTSLKSAGIVRSVRGAGGGYVLGRDPSTIHLDEVLRVLEGSMCLIDCVENNQICPVSDSCIAREVWSELSQSIQEYLANLSLDDLARRVRDREVGQMMYYI